MVTTKAIAQALHLHFYLPYETIADLTGTDRTKAARHISAGKSWQARPAHERTEAIEAARVMIEQGGR